MSMDSAGTDWEAVSVISQSSYRSRVVEELTDGPGTPTSLSERTDISVTHVSRTLTELREVAVVELLVPEDTHKGRIYGLTDSGERAAEKAQEVDA